MHFSRNKTFSFSPFYLLFSWSLGLLLSLSYYCRLTESYIFSICLKSRDEQTTMQSTNCFYTNCELKMLSAIFNGYKYTEKHFMTHGNINFIWNSKRTGEEVVWWTQLELDQRRREKPLSETQLLQQWCEWS